MSDSDDADSCDQVRLCQRARFCEARALPLEPNLLEAGE